jgi:hypothetical protein
VKRTSRSRKGIRFLIFAFVAFAAIVGSLVVKKYRISTTPSTTPPVEQAGTKLITLFFADENGRLVREGREIEDGTDAAESIVSMIDELASGPVGDYSAVLPDSTQVRKVCLQGDEAIIDFGRELYDDLPSGSAAEMTAVYAVIDTIAVNVPQVRKVLFLKEGLPVDTMKGHLDLRRPLLPDFSLEKR